jgi:hypothetical protein
VKYLSYLLLAAILTVFGTGCVGLQLTAIKATEQKPSNVAVYFKVGDATGEPLGGLTSDRFRIYEDDQLVSQYESKQTILNPEIVAVHYTLLLVDMSGGVSDSAASDPIVQAASAFTDRIEKQQKVAVYAFDGSADLYPIAPFTDQAGSAKTGVQELANFKPKDPSTNLNGAVVKALDELDNALGKATQPLKFGTLVVFAAGPDRANRIATPDMQQHIKDKPFDVLAIGLGADIKPDQLALIGKSGTALAADKTGIVKAFDDVGAKVEARMKSYYLLSYCSPSRAGRHQVRIEAFVKNSPNETEQAGSLRSEFDATGFAPGCDPTTPPSFDVARAETPAPPPAPEKDKDKDKKSEDKKEGKKEVRPAPKAVTPPPSQPPAPKAVVAPPPAQPPAPPPPKPAQPDFNP